MDWRAEYEKAVTLEEAFKDTKPTSSSQPTKKLPVDKVLVFLDLLLTHEGGESWAKLCHLAKHPLKGKRDGMMLSNNQSEQIQALRNRLASVGGQLVIKLSELNAYLKVKEPCVCKVRVLQLQLICRALCFGALTTKEKEKDNLKKEIRDLMDRVALLLDAANPPSLAVEDADERSPFQQFLQQELASRFRMLLPELVQYLLTAYELEEEEIKSGDNMDALNSKFVAVQSILKPLQLPGDHFKAIGTDKQNIVAALLQERPAKRARSDPSGLFKEVQFPHQLQQNQMHPRAQKLKRVSKRQAGSSTQSSITNKSKCAGKSIGGKCFYDLHSVASTKLTQKSRIRGYADSAKTCLVSAGQKMRKSTLLRSAATEPNVEKITNPLYSRAIFERSQMLSQQSASFSSSNSTGKDPNGVGMLKSHRAKKTSSIVMRTPDRPKRMAVWATRRVLVDASPPLRKPKKTEAAPRLLQPRSVRPGCNPPSLSKLIE